MRAAVILTALWPGVAGAWDRLDDDGIVEALSDRQVRFDAWTVQDFRADGATVYRTERYAEGRWRAQDSRYCDRWPPAEVWTCYDLHREDDRLRFTNDAGVASVGTLVE